MRPRLARFVVTAALALAGWCSPALAAVTADFDGDGILDTATLESGPRPFIRILLSRTNHPIVLPLRERPLRLIAADINRDGRIDLAGVSGRRGLVLFRNDRGGHFTRVRKPIRGRHTGLPFFVSKPYRVHRHSPGASDEAAFDGNNADDGGPVADIYAWVSPPEWIARGLSTSLVSSPRSAPVDSTAPRAPPA